MEEKNSPLFQPKTPEQKKALIELWDDPQTRPSIQKLIQSKLEEQEDLVPTVLVWDIGKTPAEGFQNFLFILCLKFEGATEENEPMLVANLLRLSFKDPNPLPLLSEHQGKTYWAKTLTSLCFFQEALQERTNRYGAPSPDTYRKRSQTTLIQTEKPEYIALAHHHKQWEEFFQEKLPTS